MDSIIKDLVRVALQNVKTQRRNKLKEKIDLQVEEIILDALVSSRSVQTLNKKRTNNNIFTTQELTAEQITLRESKREAYRRGELDTEMIEVEIAIPPPKLDFGSGALMLSLIDLKAKDETEKKKMTVAEAKPLISVTI